MPSTTHRTFCRVCEPACGLVAGVDAGMIISLAADRDHPVTKGFACHKGIATLDIHRDSDRLDHPQRRNPDGTWTDADWDEACSDIATRLGAIVAEHGPSSVAFYIGNPLGFNAVGADGIHGLMHGIGTRRLFSAGTQDCANKFVAAEAVFGTRTVHPLPDIERTDLLLIIGSNPRASRGSFIAIANMTQEMRRARARGAKVVFVDPRRVERPEQGVGDTILIRPDTDTYFLASLLAAIDERGGFVDALLARHAKHVAELRAFVHRYPAARTETVTGIPAATVGEVADDWIAASRAGGAAVHCSTGLNMGRQGTLGYWLVQMLSLVTGNLDREGGNIKSDSFYPNARAGAGAVEAGFVPSEWGPVRTGSLPGALLAEHILDAAEPVRALVVAAGNPLLSVAGEDRLRKAFEQLDLLVCVDLYRNATGELAHWVLPATDQFEREDLNLVGVGLQYRPWVQYTAALVEPKAQRRNEWWIFARLAQALGFASILDQDQPDPWARLRHMVGRSGVQLDDLVADPRAVALPPTEPGRFFTDQLQTPDGLVDCCPPVFADALVRSETIFAQLAAEPAGLKLITRRDTFMHNSWYANLPSMKRGGRETNRLDIHPADAAERGLDQGDLATVSSQWGEITVPIHLDEDLRPGVVSLVHGGGHHGLTAMRTAAAMPGVNPNALLPHGPGTYEPLSSQSHMTGIPVVVTALPVDSDQRNARLDPYAMLPSPATVPSPVRADGFTYDAPPTV
jgi:anaerobic selenocysteine-containing dehydrogenase